MEREELLVDTFVSLADTLVDDYDVIDFLQALAERCVDLLDVSAAGIMLADPVHRLRHAACSSEEMRLAELFEVQIEQGPCFDAYRDQTSVSCDSPDDAARRWPEFAPIAAEHGFVTMAAVPLRLRARSVGALNMFSSTPVKLSAKNLRVAQGMADIATIGVLQERAIRNATDLSTQLQGALESRVTIEQAKGILSEHDGISVDEAFARIRTFARSNNRLLSVTAQEIVDGTLALDALVSSTQPATTKPNPDVP